MATATGKRRGRPRAQLPTIFQHPDGSWRARWNDQQGRRHYEPQREPPGFRTRAAAEGAALEAMQADRDAAQAARRRPDQPPATIAESIDRFLADGLFSEKRRAKLAGQLQAFKDACGDLAPDELLPDRVRRYVADLAARFKPETRWQYVKALRQWSATATALGWLPEDVVRKAGPNPSPQTESCVERAFSDWDTVQRIDAAMPSWLRGLVIFLAGSGMRPEEALALRWLHVNLQTATAFVAEAWDGKRFVWPKGSREKPRTREVGLFPQAVQALQAKPQPIAAGRQQLVWTRPDGSGPVCQWEVNRAWQHALVAVGLGTFTEAPPLREGGRRRRLYSGDHDPYDCRHTFATWSLAAGVPIRDLSEEMGTSVENIERRYGHKTREANARNLSRRGAFQPGAEQQQQLQEGGR